MSIYTGFDLSELGRRIFQGDITMLYARRWIRHKDRLGAGDVAEAVMEWLLKESAESESMRDKMRLFQKMAHELPEPFATEAFNIIANGKREP